MIWAALFSPFTIHAQQTENIILITLDGFRWQEVFRGADEKLLKRTGKDFERNPIAKKFWHDDPLIRREKLMPFLWNTIATEGSLYGNRDAGCRVQLANRYWFSYPGYHEILTGHPRKAINSNRLGPNPDITVLEHLNRLPEFHGRIAVFSSWKAFPDIINEERSDIYVNSSYAEIPVSIASPLQQRIQDLYRFIPRILGEVRFDGLTFVQAFEYLKNQHPRVMMIALDETDEFGHADRYDLYLESARQSDQLIGELWRWIQSDSYYRDKTTLIITTDHGRGTGRGWKRHGRLTPHSDETWIALIGPDIETLGEVGPAGDFYNAQIAATMCDLLAIGPFQNTPRFASMLKPFENKNNFLSYQAFWKTLLTAHILKPASR
jgi:hypothetical protein